MCTSPETAVRAETMGISECILEGCVCISAKRAILSRTVNINSVMLLQFTAAMKSEAPEKISREYLSIVKRRLCANFSPIAAAAAFFTIHTTTLLKKQINHADFV